MNDGPLWLMIVAASVGAYGLLEIGWAIGKVARALDGIRDEMRKSRRNDHVT
jgi:hypothetical protein